MAESLTNVPLLISLAIGIVPSILWLIIWMRTDKIKPEPLGLLLLCFTLGGISVFFATWLQHNVRDLIATNNTRIIIFAAIEEVLKFGAFYLIAYKTPYNDETIDPAIYLIAAALGFAAVENVFYALKPELVTNITASLLTGGLRFFGSTLLHTIASCFVGIVIGLTPRSVRYPGIILGLGGAIFLHATFNFFILRNDTASFLQIYGYLWIAAIISHVILEKLRRITPASQTLNTV